MIKVDERNETENYIVVHNSQKNLWELRRKVPGHTRTIFMKSHKYSVALIVAARELEEKC